MKAWLKRTGGSIADHAWLIVTVLLAGLAWFVLRDRRWPAEAIQREIVAVQAARRARGAEIDQGRDAALAEVRVRHAAELKALDEASRRRAAELEADPVALSKFLVRAGSRAVYTLALVAALATPAKGWAIECDVYEPTKCAADLKKGEKAPFNGQLLTVPLAADIGVKAADCDSRVHAVKAQAEELWTVRMDAEAAKRRNAEEESAQLSSILKVTVAAKPPVVEDDTGKAVRTAAIAAGLVLVGAAAGAGITYVIVKE